MGSLPLPVPRLHPPQQEDQFSRMSPTSVLSQVRDVSGTRALVLFDYQSEDPRMLPAQAGQVLWLLWERESWYYSRDESGQEGLVPSTYIEIIS